MERGGWGVSDVRCSSSVHLFWVLQKGVLMCCEDIIYKHTVLLLHALPATKKQRSDTILYGETASIAQSTCNIVVCMSRHSDYICIGWYVYPYSCACYSGL